MAASHSHAGGNNGRSFDVRLLPEHGQPIELAAGVTDFLDAVELATDWLEHEDPGRDGSTGIAVFALREGARPEIVWHYPAADQPAPQRSLVDTFGFDPVGWVSAVQEFKGERRLPAPAPAHLHLVDDPSPAEEPDQEAGRRRGRRRSLVPLVRSAWEDDQISRACLIAAAVSLWLAVTLADARFLVVLLAALGGLWLRRGRRAEAAAAAANDAELL
jgi:hypothetical protein